MHWIVGVVFANFAVIYYMWPSALQPTMWLRSNDLMKFEGNMEQNTILSEAVLIPGNFSGPESFTFDPDSGETYVSLADGTVAAFNSDGSFIERIFFTGGYIVSPVGKKSNGLGFEGKFLQSWCKLESAEGRLPWNQEAERKCGRPLGLRFIQTNGEKFLFVLDAYHGLFKLNLTTRTAEHIVTPKTKITVAIAGNYDSVVTSTPLFYNDLDINENGQIVFTDSSHKNTRSENRVEVLDGAPRGRLFLYKPIEKTLHVLLCGLHFPNGVQFINQNEVIVGELTRFRALKVNITCPFITRESDVEEGTVQPHACASCEESGTLEKMLELLEKTPPGDERRGLYLRWGVDVFIDSVPGLIDNIRLDHEKRLLYLGLGSKSAAPFSLLHFLFSRGLLGWVLRDWIGKFVPMKLVAEMIPKYGLVVTVNFQGEIVSSLHDPTGRIHFVSQADRNPVTGDLWLGSHSANLAMLPRDKFGGILV